MKWLFEGDPSISDPFFPEHNRWLDEPQTKGGRVSAYPPELEVVYKAGRWCQCGKRGSLLEFYCSEPVRGSTRIQADTGHGKTSVKFSLERLRLKRSYI